MGLTARLGKVVWRRIEASPRYQEQAARLERIGPVSRAAHSAGYSPLDDEAASAQLRERLDAPPEVIEEALADLAPLGMRRDYVADRSYRLLAAVAVDSPVAPIRPELAELFAREEALGRMPMRQAFERLAEIEPNLRELPRQAAAAANSGGSEGCGLPKDLRERVNDLLGGGARSDDALLDSNLATSIVEQYLLILVGDTRLGTPEVSYFDAPLKRVVARVRGEFRVPWARPARRGLPR